MEDKLPDLSRLANQSEKFTFFRRWPCKIEWFISALGGCHVHDERVSMQTKASQISSSVN